MSEQNFQLLVQRGPEPGKVYPLSSVTITIGRDPMADITITDPEVSRQHVRLVGTLTGFAIQDLGSTNGTYIDGERLSGEAVELIVGQVIKMGTGVALQFQTETDTVTSEEMPTMLDGALMAPVFPQEDDGEVDSALDLPQSMQDAPLDQEISHDESDPGSEDFKLSDQDSDYAPIAGVQLDEANERQADYGLVEDRDFDSSEFAESSVPSPAPAEAKPIIIPHQGESEQDGVEENSWRAPAVIISLILLLICCCCGFFLFIYYYGGDWMLRQLGLLP